jgi:soluble lytic murein transglycosylase
LTLRNRCVIVLTMNTAVRLLPVWLLLAFSLACNAVNSLPIFATSTPENTPTSTSTPAPTRTPTPTPTPTPLPEARVALGDQALFNGDWDSALREYQTALGTSPEVEIQMAARLGLGRTYFLAGSLDEAENALQSLIEEDPSDQITAVAYFFLAQVYSAQNLPLEAVDAYEDYLDLRPGIIASTVHELRGDAFLSAGEAPAAVLAYQAALQSDRLSGDLSTEIKLARAYALSGDYTTAIVAYQDIYNRSSSEFTKAQMNLLMGQAYLALDEPEKAYAVYQDNVNSYPRAYDSYTALLALVNAGIPVNEFQRGLVDYHAGEYGVALAAFDRYLQSSPEDPSSGLYHKALTLRALGDYQDAIDAWDEVIQTHANSDVWDDAWEQKAFTHWYYLDQYARAVDVLVNFVEEVPTHPRAGEFLYDAASIAERSGKLDRAALLWERTATEYPGYEQASRSLFLAGITRYRQANYEAANHTFQLLLGQPVDLEQRAAAFLWSGKSQLAMGDETAAHTAWEQGAAVDPTGYYSERARDLLDGLAPFTPPPEYDLVYDPGAERAEAEAWIRTVFNLPGSTDLSGPGPLQDDSRFKRGNELWRLGLYDEARLEFEDLRQEVSNDPANSYRLANHLIEIGLYRSGIVAARQVLTLAGMDDAETMSAPIYFNHLRFGTYFRELVIPASQAYNIHPLFLFSLIRQESLFEGFVHSSAGARGLMQIIPSTGQEVATNAGWPPGYTSEDLYRPLVSITLGSDYLNRQRAFLGGDLYAALAAYNGGPGNALTWQKLVPPDPDLYLEVVRFEETRTYIRRIYEIFNIYRKIYNRTP